MIKIPTAAKRSNLIMPHLQPLVAKLCPNNDPNVAPIGTTVEMIEL